VWASDRSRDALAVASGNLARLATGVRLIAGDLLAAFRAGAFDVVVSNPPYCAEPEIALLDPEVRDFEPRGALAAGALGLDVLRALVGEAARVLAAAGWLLVEVGAGQAPAVRGFLEADGRYTERANLKHRLVSRRNSMANSSRVRMAWLTRRSKQ
jgi:release factor glutamine methyltransferase